MALRTFRPTSPGLRHLVLVDRSGLWKGGPVKMLTEGKTKSGGRNNDGRITHAPHRRRAQAVLPARRLPPPQARRAGGGGTLEYDPNRTAFIALIKYEDGELAYILAPQRLAAGDRVVAGAKVDVKPNAPCRCRPCRSARSCTTSR